jgi:Leucine-rich repeat (LRR) protein
MTMLQAIYISTNRLTSYIPSRHGSCKELEYLNLSCNTLEGPIPMSLGELQSLQDMDFSSNNLSGGIPMSLENIKILKQLNFSFNNLSGEVLKGGVFKNLSAMTFMGNPGLCGPWVNLSLFSTRKHKSVSHLKKVFISIVAVADTVVSCLFLGIFSKLNHKRNSPTDVGA